jgi:hypothetical protein
MVRTQEQIDRLELGVGVLPLTLYSDMEEKIQYLRPVKMMENCAGFKMLFLQGRRF